MLQPWREQIGNTGCGLMSMGTLNPTKVLFALLGGAVLINYAPPSKVILLSGWNQRFPTCPLGLNSNATVNRRGEEIGRRGVREEVKRDGSTSKSDT